MLGKNESEDHARGGRMENGGEERGNGKIKDIPKSQIRLFLRGGENKLQWKIAGIFFGDRWSNGELIGILTFLGQ